MKTMRAIGIVGGGASGLMAAITAAADRDVHVFILEQDASPEKDPIHRERQMQPDQ